ncbi:hypothetical protein ACFRAO_10810 [Streptomyces sp. NPDC056656]|uniref:hypothetical protein n=1 Tax=Streptomyces sp. NPDC056656 TaxID=3345895 RepID=UPI00368F0559
MTAISNIPSSAITPVMSALLSLGSTDVALRKLGATTKRHPASYGDSWVDHLGWGADSAFVAARLLFSGQLVGAAAVLRSQFERWTENAAFNSNVHHEKGESAASFAARAWSRCHTGFPSASRIAPERSDTKFGASLADIEFWEDERSPIGFQGPSISVGEGYDVYPAALMEFMSELLHGRDRFIEVVQWESCLLLEGDPALLSEAAQLLSDVLLLNIRQIRLCLATLAGEQGKPQLAPGMFSLPELTFAGNAGPALFSLIPLIPETGLSPEIVQKLKAAEFNYDEVMRGKRPAGRHYRDDEMTLLYFYERRARAAAYAIKAFKEEEEALKENFSLDGLSSRGVLHIMAAEMAGLASAWLPGKPQGNAAALCSSALRSAHWLWLEDDDRAMALLRVVLEQCARLRTWTTKPDKAAKLEASRSTTPKDWLNAAGFRRLQSLNRAFGEFAHFHAKIRLDGARNILVKVQRDGESASALHTARGHALDAMAALVLQETIGCVKPLSSVVATAFSKIADEVFVGSEGENLQQSLDALLDRALLLKDEPLGDYSLRGPAEATRIVADN